MGKKLDLLPGTLDLLILETLSRNRAMHGYGIAQSLASATQGVLDVDEGSLYPALQRLLLKGGSRPAGARLMEAMLRVLRPA